MNTTEPSATKPDATRRYPLILLCAFIGFALAATVTALLPLDNEFAFALAYPAVFAIAATSIGVIFKMFVRKTT